MNFEILEFIKKVPQGISRQALGQKIYEEIRNAENMKVGFLDQAFEKPEFYVDLSGQLDTYINHLKTLHNRLSPVPEHLDEELFTEQQPDIDQINKLIARIEEFERNRLTGDQ